MATEKGTFTVSTQLLDDQLAVLEQSVPAIEVLEPGKANLMRMRYRIPATCKRDMLRRLHFLNITAETLFPGIDGLGRELEEQVRLVDP